MPPECLAVIAALLSPLFLSGTPNLVLAQQCLVQPLISPAGELLQWSMSGRRRSRALIREAGWAGAKATSSQSKLSKKPGENASNQLITRPDPGAPTWRVPTGEWCVNQCAKFYSVLYMRECIGPGALEPLPVE